jgi:hypothetical protein
LAQDAGDGRIDFLISLFHPSRNTSAFTTTEGSNFPSSPASAFSAQASAILSNAVRR